MPTQDKAPDKEATRAALPITQFGDPVLRLRADPVALDAIGSPDVQNTIEDMVASLAAAGGIGLAAPQISVARRIIIIKIPSMVRMGYGQVEETPLLVMINPQIVSASPDMRRAPEACLSINSADGGTYEGILERPESVVLRGYDRGGKEITVHASRLLSRALQHEVDHLDGILFTDRIRDLKDLRIYHRVELTDPVLGANTYLSAEVVTM